MTYALTFLLLALGLCVAMLFSLEIGRKLGGARRAKEPESADKGSGAVEAAVFGLMGLLIAFTFSGAASRFDERRQLVVQEANAIGTAYLRIDLLPADLQPLLREKFRRYVDARLAFYGKLPNLEQAKPEFDHATALQGEIWSQAVTGCRNIGSPAVTSLVLSALNEMIDITTTRAIALETHPPSIIFVMLGILVLSCSLLAGYNMSASKTRDWLHMLSFAALLTVAIYVILDLEYPRAGLIRVHAVDHVLVDLRQSMK